MREHELLVLCRGIRLLAKLACTQRAIDQRHAHDLALALAEGETIAAREAWWLGRRTLELVDHLAFGHGHAAERHREPDILGEELHLDLAEPYFAGERMSTAVAALGRIAEREQEAFVAARKVLQAQIAAGRNRQRFAREIADRLIVAWR